ncbi:MAG TPA: hypothetical protein VJG85_00945 [Patescibacteria group bacterium]|nr:hypothetical protein [Patescibacteria group bacterium]
MMYIPTIAKPKQKNDVLIERALPTVGNVTAKVGDNVEPFTRLGMSKISYEKTVLGEDFKPVKHKREGSYFYQEEKIGSIGFSKVLAPYNGYLVKEGKDYVFKQEERDYWLLSGAWGEVTGVVKDISVLIRTQNVDLSFVACTRQNIQGELIVFPNPTEILVKEYLENFSKNINGKIIYVGNYLSSEVVERAIDLKAAGLIAGGADRSTFTYAKENAIFIGLFVGFGHCQVPSNLFEVLKNVSNRFVFVQGGNKLLRIPVPEKFGSDVLKQSSSQGILREVKKGLNVLVLQKPYFGVKAEVDRVSGNSIFVRFPEKDEILEVKIPNVLSLE